MTDQTVLTADPRTPASSPFHARLQEGVRYPAEPLTESPFFGLEGDMRMKPLEPLLVPEPARAGEDDGDACVHCHSARAIWHDEHWKVTRRLITGLPFGATLSPTAHSRLDQLSGDALHGFGEVVQRLSEAIKAVDGVARTHFSRWGDGAAHLHIHFMARPLGMRQGRGPMLAFWDEVLPRVEDDLLMANARVVSAAMAARGGVDLLAGS